MQQNISATVIGNHLLNGIKLVPVGEVDKKPYVKWNNKDKIEFNELYDIMWNKGTRAVAMVFGEVSGRLICIDIDVKYKKGFDAKILGDLRELYPHLYERFRIEQTPSGGYHLLYRVGGTETMPGCPKLASRKATNEELLVEPKNKIKCFLELKGEGGLAQCYPSPNYVLIQDRDIPVFTWEEHCSIIELCKSYDEIIEPERVKITQHERDYYAETPYDQFDISKEGEDILLEFDWNIYKQAGYTTYYRRPGKSDNEVSAWFNHKNRLYKIFTTKTELDTKSYSPSNLLAKLKFNDDKKQLYAYLVSKGYGKIKESVEKSIVKNKAKSGEPLPNNISEDGKKLYEGEVQKIKEKYPFGVFWDIDDNGNYEISHLKLDNIIYEMGFRMWQDNPVKIDGYLIKKYTEQSLINELFVYIGDEEDIYNEMSKFIHKYEKLIFKRLGEYGKLPSDRLYKSSKHNSYKFYQNCVVSVTKSEINTIEYSEIGEKLVFEDAILKRNYRYFNEYRSGKYYEYLKLCLGVDEHLERAIGYLAHDFIDDSMNSIIIALEQCEDPQKGGGSGKNLFFNILNHITSVHVISGVQAELDKNLLQSYNGQKVLVISDVPEKFDVSWFKDFSSGTAQMKKLFKDVKTMDRDEMPKPVILTNFSYKMAPGLERRIIELEFTEFFSRIRGGVGKHFGMMFPGFKTLGDWQADDWAAFDTMVLTSIQKFLQVGELTPKELSNSGWIKQFNQNYSHLYDFIKNNIDDWIILGRVDNNTFMNSYHNYCKDNSVGQRYIYSSTKINLALKDYCKKHEISFNKDGVWKAEGMSTIMIRGRIFKKEEDVKEEIIAPKTENVGYSYDPDKDDLPF